MRTDITKRLISFNDVLKEVFITIHAEADSSEKQAWYWHEDDYPYDEAREDGWKMYSIFVYAECDDLEGYTQKDHCWAKDWFGIQSHVINDGMMQIAILNLRKLMQEDLGLEVKITNEEIPQLVL